MAANESQSFTSKPIIAGHRGYRGKFPENTMLGFREAVRAGANVIELDIQVAKDDVVVICHDVDTGRCFNENHTVCDVPYHGVLDALLTNDEFKEPMPILEEVAQAFYKDTLFKDIKLMIDIKRSNGPEVVPLVAETLVRIAPLKFWEANAIFGVWRLEVMQAVEQYAPTIDVTFIGWEQSLAYKFMLRKQVKAISLNFATLSILGGDRVMEAARKRNLMIYVWTVNAPETMKWCVAARVNGVITDFPDIFGHFLSTVSEHDMMSEYFTSEPNGFYSLTWMVRNYLAHFVATAYLAIADHLPLGMRF